MEILIREATEADVPVILEMIRGLAEFERLSHVVTATENALRRTLFGTQRGAEVLLACEGEVCQGFALFFPNYSTFVAKPGLFLEDLFVRTEARGRGIGFALLQSLAKIARERDYGRIEWNVLDWNEAAIRFYKRIGAVPMDEWTTFRVEGDAIVTLAEDSR